MNPSIKIKSFLPLSAACGALLASLAVAPSAQAGTPAYYAAAQILPPADFTTANRLSAVAMNKQGYVLVHDVAGGDKRVLVYKDGQLLTLASIAATGQPGLSALSDVAADGSFNVVGDADFADGFHRVVFWHVNADGTSTAQIMQNRVLGEDSTNPGEQHSASAVAVNSVGKIAGSVQSYLAGLGAFWYPPDITPHSEEFGAYDGPIDMDESGNFCGQHSGVGGSPVAEYNHNDLVLPDNIDSRATKLKNGLILGEYLTPAPEYKDVKFVYNVATTSFQPLPSLVAGDYITTTALGYHGEAAGYASSGSLGGTATLYLPDATTGTYAATNLQTDILSPLYPANEISAKRYGTEVVGFAGDGSMVVYGLTNAYYGPGEQYILILKPGADLRPNIITPDPTYPTQVFLSAKPGQPFSYQFRATNNPTAFRLVDSADRTKDATLPGGLSFNKATGVLSGTGPVIGVTYFTVEATNGQGLGAHRSFVAITSGDAPVITSGSTASAHLNQPFTFQVTATNSPTDFYFTGLPEGLTYDYNTGLISGTPTKAGTFAVTEKVDNAATGGFSLTPSGAGTLTITVDDKPPAAFTVALIKPADNVSVVAGLPLTAKAKVDLTNAGGETVASIGFLLDGKPLGAKLTAKPYKEVLVIDGALTGTHTLTAVATANDGRAATSEPLTINVAPRFVDLAGSASFNTKINAKGKLVVTGSYTLSNRGNTSAGSFPVKFYLSRDASFDPTDLEAGPLVAALTGKNTLPSIVIPGLPANTTVSSSDAGTLLPAIRLTVPATALGALNLSGKYLLAVIDPDNTADETTSTRANNVIAVLIP